MASERKIATQKMKVARFTSPRNFQSSAEDFSAKIILGGSQH